MTCHIHQSEQGQCCNGQCWTFEGASKKRELRRAMAAQTAWSVHALVITCFAFASIFMAVAIIADASFQRQDTINQEILNHD